MRTEMEKMLAGELYDPLDPELVQARDRARDLCQDLNATREKDQEARRLILTQLFGQGVSRPRFLHVRQHRAVLLSHGRHLGLNPSLGLGSAELVRDGRSHVGHEDGPCLKKKGETVAHRTCRLGLRECSGSA